jgi:hypothetical protein
LSKESEIWIQNEPVPSGRLGHSVEPYEDKPDQALRLGLNLAILRTELDGRLIKSQPVMESLDDAMEILFPDASLFFQAD